VNSNLRFTSLFQKYDIFFWLLLSHEVQEGTRLELDMLNGSVNLGSDWVGLGSGHMRVKKN